MPLNRIEIFRHGDANYQQGQVDWQIAADLTKNGKATIDRKARNLAEEYRRINTKVFVYTSPLARTIETALIIARELNNIGIEVEHDGDAPVITRKALQDQRNYSHSTMRLLACGGTWDEDGISFVVDPKITNPMGKKIEKYGVTDARKIDFANWVYLPEKLKKKIWAIETNDSVRKRGLTFLKALNKKIGEKELTIIVTHDAVISQLLDSAGSETTRINPGESVMVEKVKGDLLVRRIGEKGIIRPMRINLDCILKQEIV